MYFSEFVALLLCFTSVSCIEREPLTDRILRYDTLDYNSEVIHDHHERLKKSTARISSNTHIFVSFYAFDRNFTLELWPSRDVFSNGVQFLVHTNEGIVPSSYDPSTFYKGRIVGDQSSKVQGHLKNGVFDGEVTTGLMDKYHIETAEKFFKGKNEFHSVIYSLEDVLFQVEGKESGCAAKKELLNKLELLQATARPITRKSSLQRNDPSSTLTSQFKAKRSLDKRTKTVSGGRFCPVFIAADHFFVSNIGGGDDSAAIAEIASIFSTVQEIYINADFDEDGSADNILPVLVKTELLTSSSYDGLFSSDNIDVSDYLNKWSEINHEDICLALLLTYRDFDNGVLGLAWVAQPPGGSRGGVCEGRTSLSIGERSLNTAIVTYLNYGSRQPRPVVSITIAHEFGHNFGSSHDPDGSDECSPGGGDGNFIMYPSATDGNRPNNDVFSPCSNSAIEQILLTKTDCFTTSAAFCGNQITETNEQCDCGSSDPDICAAVDPCCEPGECVFKPSASCSAKDDCCDSSTCQFKPLNDVCNQETECGERSVCNGVSAECPQQVNKNTPCNNGTRFCENAECTGSVCLVLTPPSTDCQCTVEEEQCHVCCMIDDTCTSTFTLASEGTLQTAGQYRESGRSCDEYRGYCSDDATPVCTRVDNEQTLNDLLDLFSLDTLNSVLMWLRTYWWVPIIVIVVVIIMILLLHFTYRKRKPIKKVARRASASVGRRPSASGTGVDAAAVRARERVKNNDNREKLQRLKKFFPTCDGEMILSVLRSCKTEEKTVKQLITLGFPMKKVPIPRL